MAFFDENSFSDAFPDYKSDAEKSEVKTKQDLVSLATSRSSALRALAVKNLRYYPEHLDILLALLNTEVDRNVLQEIEQSITSVSTDDDKSEYIRLAIVDSLEHLEATDPGYKTCMNLLANL